jgi:DNA end-binding protein Ku
MRAIWKGHVRFSLVTIPIRIYTAIESEAMIRFNQLSKKTNNPVTYDKRDKITGEKLLADEIVKGYQYEPGQYVVVEADDMEKIKLKSTKVIEIEAFVDATEVHPTLYDTPYFIGPDGEVAAKTYALLRQSLKESGKVGIGRVVLRDRESLVMLNPQEQGLILYKLRFPREVRDIKNIPQLNGQEADKDQLKLAKTLIDSMSKTFDEIDMTDRYHNALKEIIMAKVEGKEIVVPQEEEQKVVDIMSALKQSIEQARADRKPMKKVAGQKEKEEAKATKSGKRKTG